MARAATFARDRLWLLYLAAGAVCTLIYLTVPPLRGSGPFMNMLGLSGVAAVIFGMRRNRPSSTLPWWLFAGGLALFWLGDVYTYSYPKLVGHDVPFPSIGDALYLAVYPALMAGLIVIVRRRGKQGDRTGGIDAMIVALGLALPSWVWLIAPYVHDDSLSTLPKLVSVAYPLGDLMLLVPAVVLALDGGRRRGSFYLLSASIVALLVTDFVYGLMILNGTFNHQLSLDVGWIAFYILWGASALHPSMVELDRPSSNATARLTPLRLALLAGASLIAPAILFVTEAQQGNVDVLVVIGASVVLFGLVVARMAGLVRQQERSVARERVLSNAGAALAAATGRDEIEQAVLDAIGPLLQGPGTALLCERHVGGLRIVARSDDRPSDSEVLLSPPTARALLDLADAPDRRDSDELAPNAREELHLDGAYDHVISLGLHVRGEVLGLLVVARPRATAEPIVAALRSLATNFVLALESATLTEQVQRRKSEARFESLVQHSSDLITVVGADATITYQSPSSERVLGYTPEELLGTRFDSLLVGGDRARLLHLLTDGPVRTGSDGEVLECTLRHKDGSEREFEILHTNLLDDEHVQGVVLNARDIGERKAFEEQLAHQAFHDAVTGLPNRAFFVERVRQAIARARREDSGLAIIFLDLDDFKTINDSLGHAAGDDVLLSVAKRLDASVRASDTAARFGGDEFAILLEDVQTVDEGAETAERIIEALAQPMSIGGKELSIRCSLGISVLESEGRGDADELIRNADAAMYIAKRDGKGAYRMFEPAMHEGVMARLELRADLQRALTAGEFELAYQPVVHLSDGSMSGVEALIRWRHPERGMMEPDSFIPLRRGERPDRADRALGAARGLPPGDADPAQGAVQPAAHDERQPVGQAAAAQRRRRRRARRADRVRARARAADARDHRVGPDDRHRARRPAPRRAARDRRAPGDGRLRHRLLVAQLPQPLPRRRPQDGPLVPARGRDAAGLRPGARRRRARRDAAARGRRRGHRAPRPVDAACATSAATSARASTSRVRWTPPTSSRRCRTGLAGSTAWAPNPATPCLSMHHSYEELDRGGRRQPASAHWPR